MRSASVASLAFLLTLCACANDGEATLRDRTVAERIAALRDPAPERRADAAAALGEPWPETARAVPLLVVALGDESDAVRTAARRALRSQATRAAPTIVRALGRLRKGGEAGMQSVLSLLSALGAAITPSDIAHALTFEDEGGAWAKDAGALDVRRGAATALAFVGRFGDDADVLRIEGDFRLTAWRAAVSEADEEVRARGAASLAVLGADAARGDGSDPWIVPLGDEDRATLLEALSPPASVGRDSGAPEMDAVARPPDFLANRGAVSLLWRLPVSGTDVAAALRSLLERDRDDDAALHALATRDPRALRKVLETASPLTSGQREALLRSGDVARVRKGLSDASPRERVDTAEALADAGVLDREVLQVLLDAVRTEQTEVRARVPRWLDRIGGAGKDLAEHVVLSLRSVRFADAERADALALAIARASPAGVDLAGTWRARSTSLAKAGRTPESARFDDWHRAFVHAVAATNDARRLAAFVAVLDPAGDDPRPIEAACAAIGRLGPKADAAVAPLMAWLDAVRQATAKSSRATSEVPGIEELKTLGAMADLPYQLRAPAVEALGLVGPKASSAVPALESLRSSGQDERIHHHAARALRRIRAR